MVRGPRRSEIYYNSNCEPHISNMSHILAILTLQYLSKKSFSLAPFLQPPSYLIFITPCLDHYASKWNSPSPVSLHSNCCQINLFFFKDRFIYFRERKSKNTSWGTERKKQTPLSMQLNTGLDLTTPRS